MLSPDLIQSLPQLVHVLLELLPLVSAVIADSLQLYGQIPLHVLDLLHGELEIDTGNCQRELLNLRFHGYFSSGNNSCCGLPRTRAILPFSTW
jgi:hypothetical protein